MRTGNDFEIPVFDFPDNREVGYSVASNCFEDIWSNDDYWSDA